MEKHDTDKHDQYGAEEADKRLQKTLRAAFSMKATPLKAIPRKRGKNQPPRSAPKAKRPA